MDQQNITIAGVSSADVDSAWSLCEPWIGESLARGHVPMATESVRRAIARAELQLWIVSIRGEPVAAFVTEIRVMDYGKGLWVVACGGTGMREWLPEVESTLQGFARDKGCDHIQMSGRRGWLREMKSYGWRETSISMRKEV